MSQHSLAVSPQSNMQASRWAGGALLLMGVLFVFLAAGVSLAETTDGGERGVLHGSGEGEWISGADGNDRLHGLSGDDGLSGGPGKDELYGGPGYDVLLGGGGDDFVEARDGKEDYVDCGKGSKDVASVDVEDHVSAGCERVYQD
ncbi:MAG: hypothetical protein WA982_15835 [Rubrobacteraceae bacterium]